MTDGAAKAVETYGRWYKSMFSTIPGGHLRTESTRVSKFYVLPALACRKFFKQNPYQEVTFAPPRIKSGDRITFSSYKSGTTAAFFVPSNLQTPL